MTFALSERATSPTDSAEIKRKQHLGELNKRIKRLKKEIIMKHGSLKIYENAVHQLESLDVESDRVEDVMNEIINIAAMEDLKLKEEEE